MADGKGIELAKAYVQIVPSAKGIEGSLSDTMSAAGESAGKSGGGGIASGMKSALGAIGKTAMVGITAASAGMVKFGKDAIDVGSAFDSSMSQVAATLGLTTSDIINNVGGAGDIFDALSEKAEEAGRSTIFSASDAADGLNILAMSGYSANESIEMLDDVLHLAAAGGMDMGSAAAYVAGSMKGFNDSTKGSAYYADLMAKGATLANTNVQQLGEAMSSGAAGAAAYGQSADSMTIALLRLAEQGDVGSAAGTALSAAMKNLYTPTNQAKEALEELGVAAYKDGKALDFNDIVNNLSEALSGYSEEEANAYKQTIFGIQGLNAFNKMTVTSVARQEEWIEALQASSEGAGETSRQYDTMTDNLAGDISAWGSALDGFKISVSKELMPTVRGFVQLATDGMSSVTAAFKENGIEGAVSEFSSFLSDVVRMIAEKIPSFVTAGSQIFGSVLKGVLEALPSITEQLPVMMGAFLGLVQDIVLGIIEFMPVLAEQLAAAIPVILPMLIDGIMSLMGSLIDNVGVILEPIMEGLPEFMSFAMEFLTELFMGIIEELPSIINTITALLTDLILMFVELLPEILPELITGVISLFVMLTEHLDEILVPLLEGLGTIFGVLLREFPGLVVSIVKTLVENFPKLMEGLKNIFFAIKDALYGALKNVWAEIGDKVTAALEAARDFLTEVFTNIWNKITEIFGAAAGWFRDNVTDPVIGFFKEVWDKVSGFFMALWNGIVDAWHTVMDPWFEIMRRAFAIVKEQVIDPLTEDFRAMWEFISNLAEAAWNAVMAAWETVSSWFNEHITEPLGDLFSSLWETASEAAEDAWEAIKLVFGTFAEWFGDIFSAAWEKIKEKCSPLGEIFKSIGDGIAETFKIVVNAIIRGINAVVALPFNGINAVLDKLRGLSILGVSPFGWIGSIAVPQIPELATGGVVNGPRIALIGEAGAEAVVPLERNTEWIQRVAAELSSESGNEGIYRLIEKVDEMSKRLEDMRIYLDTGELVGGISGKMNESLGIYGQGRGRGLAFS